MKIKLLVACLLMGLEVLAGLFCGEAKNDGLEAVFKGVDFYTGARLKRLDGELEEPVFDIGAALRTRDFTFLYSEDVTDHLPRRWGAKYHIDGNYFWYDTTLYYGTLGFARSVSRLKRPLLSIRPSVGMLLPLKPGLAPNLPTFTSGERPVAAAGKFKPSVHSRFLPAFEGALLQNGDIYSSVYTRLGSWFTLSCTSGDFFYGRKPVSSWFYKEPFYRQKRYKAADAELSFCVPGRCTLNFTEGFSENPNGDFSKSFFWDNTSLSIVTGLFTVNCGAFHARRPDMILPAGRKLNVKSQFFVNPQIHLASDKVTFRMGFLAANEKKLKKGLLHDYYRYGLKSVCEFNNLRFSFQYGKSFYKEYENESVCTYTGSVSYKAEPFYVSSSVTLTERAFSESLSARVNILPKSGALSKISVFTTCEKGKKGEKYKAGADAYFSYSSKKLSWKGKISYNLTFSNEF